MPKKYKKTIPYRMSIQSIEKDMANLTKPKPIIESKIFENYKPPAKKKSIKKVDKKKIKKK